jgi:aminomuconate-semialdehyde/2-hydroxymuconate-6-semialdehyde dehydrogenase
MRGPWPRLDNLIGGELRPPVSGRYLPVHEPATAGIYAQVADSEAADIDAAVRAAREAAPGWAALAPSARARWLEKLADAIEARLDDFATAESKDSGKPLATARTVDIPRSIHNFRHFAAEARTFGAESYAGEVGLEVVLRQPLGAVACISPWNLPLYLLSWKLAPALAAGNTVVAKPSELTPATASMLAELCVEIGLPPGVLNLVHGLGAKVGPPLTTHRDIRAVSFTGSTATGAAIAQGCASLFRKLSLELGGKNASIVFADADVDAAVAECVRAAFSNQGQICLCGSRVLVEKSIYRRFLDAFVEQARAIQPGDPADPATRFGALVSQAHLDKVLGCIELAHTEGGRLLLGGERVRVDGRCEDGWFLPPTVFDQLSFDCRTNREEIFGPVVTLLPFDDEAQALAFANGTDYGLAASVFTRDLDRARRMAERLQAGLVWINGWMRRDLRVPFGGVKRSGLGREGGAEAMRFFTEAKSVHFG